jgi:DNA-binding MarR family transcriptional regulator
MPEKPVSGASAQLQLERFVPFRLNRLAVAVSENLSEIYRETFGLDVPEWRVLVTVCAGDGCTAQHIAASTRMHKTRVSRAVASLSRRKLIERTANPTDAREQPLHATAVGRQLYQRLVPLALAREREILSCLDRQQQDAFLLALDQLETALDLRDEHFKS